MWAGHVHDHKVWANLIAPQREQAGARAELIWASTPWHQRPEGLAPFGDILVLFAKFLNSTYEAHRWPRQYLLF